MPRPKGSKNKSKADLLHTAYSNTPHPRKGWPKGNPRGKKAKTPPAFDSHFAENLTQVILGLTALFLELKNRRDYNV